MEGLAVGETFVAGATGENARTLLAAARKQGLDVAVVRAVEGGFIVPTTLVEDEKEKASTASRKPTRSRRNKAKADEGENR